jgi:ubiquinone/menaquinone biosynthesis C-methylase UbiE
VARRTRTLADTFDKCVRVDISGKMIEQARPLYADNPNCSFVLNTTDHLGFAGDGSFDFVCSNIVLQHLPSRSIIATYVRELIRLLPPGGRERPNADPSPRDRSSRGRDVVAPWPNGSG